MSSSSAATTPQLTTATTHALFDSNNALPHSAVPPLNRTSTINTLGGLSDWEQELDEVNVNWCRLVTRVICIILFVLIIVCFALGEISYKIYILAAIIAAVLGLVFLLSFLDLDLFKSSYVSTLYSRRFSTAAPSRETLARPLMDDRQHNSSSIL